MSVRRWLLAAFLLAAVYSLAFAQGTVSEKPLLDRGLELFRAERYREALDLFGRLLADPKTGPDRQEAAYYSVLS